mgnify:CR=1 FL=1
MKIQDFASRLFEARITYHVMHLQTLSFAQHMALNDLYSNIVEYTDRILETYQGEYTIIRGYKSTIQISESDNPIDYTKQLIKDARMFRKSIELEEIKAIVDELVEFLNNNLYKLKSLK